MLSHKIIFTVLLCGLIFPASMALAAGDPSSEVMEFNTLCWKVEDCEKAREAFSQDASKAELKKGWIEKGGNCKTGWGLCLPAGKTKTSISFAGKTEFLHIGDYILTVYKYALTIASIIAVVMIIAAGIQWLTSGGNSDMITKAKTRITGAFVGLFILYASYFILNTINPALVNLRLPQTYMIKPKELAPTFCINAPSTTKFAYGGDYKDQIKKLDKPSGEYEFEYKKYFGSAEKPYNKIDDKTKEKFYCGHRFFIEDAGNSTCFGNYCPKTGNKMHACGAFGTEATKKYICKQATVAGEIVYKLLSPLPSLDPSVHWETNEITNEGEQELWIMCKDGRKWEISSTGETISSEGWQSYTIVAEESDIDKAIKDCGGETNAGFAIKFEMNLDVAWDDQDHFLGKDANDISKYFVAYYSEVAKTISSEDKFKNLIPAGMIKNGLQMNINANTIKKY